MKSDLVDIPVILWFKTEKAYLISQVEEEKGEKVWVPKSLCELEVDDKNPSLYVLTLPEKVALEKGLL